jgi:rubrerythrin
MGDEAKEEVRSKTQNEKRKEQSPSMASVAPLRAGEKYKFICDRCGFEMVESNCKIICPNCGNRFDCSDLNIYFD